MTRRALLGADRPLEQPHIPQRPLLDKCSDMVHRYPCWEILLSPSDLADMAISRYSYDLPGGWPYSPVPVKSGRPRGLEMRNKYFAMQAEH
jgi:hypothetical protein